MRRTPASSSYLPSPDFYEKVGRLQQGLRDSEKKRLDLEKKLYEYHQSDIFRAKLKYVKLKKHLEEICESEKKANIRNQEYLKRLERLQAEIERDVTRNTEKHQELKVVMPAGINSTIVVSRGLYHPATIFMGRQMSAISSIGDFSAEQKSPQPPKNFSIPDPCSHRQTAQSSNVTDSCVVQTSSDTQYLNKSDKTDGKTSFHIGEKTPVTASLFSEEEQTRCLEIGSNARHDHLAHGDSKSQRQMQEQKMFRKMQEKQEEDLSSSSDLTVSVSEDDLILRSPEPQPKPGDKIEGEDGIQALKLIHTEQERDALSTDKNNHILQTLSSPDSKKESSTNSPTRELCNHSDILKEDLEAYRAAVPHQLSRLLPGDKSSEKQVRFEQSPDSGLLKARLGQHVAALKEHDTSLKEEAIGLLKKALTEECEDNTSAIHSNESSCSLLSILNDNSGIKEAKPALWLNSVRARKQEVSSGCGDESKEESMATKIPITETKAYQFLKKSILQDNTNQIEDRFQKADASVSQFSGLNIGSSAFKTKTTNKIALEASFSSSKGSPLSRHENKKKPMTSLKSNAFWGESDDSNSEIEAALRPRNTSIDGFDDFDD
ncbi:centrosomal protein kizuna isoform X2 [Cynocephalus volans]|uniref:centrosomal protein kizuna isoform X2 n=1 Tax=Cynocephalus volans TaxID=110931 RepID=UPI002FC7112B